VLLPVAAAGTVVARRRHIRLWPFAATVVLVSVTTVAAYGIVRFRVPADVSIVVLAGLAVGAAVDRLKLRAGVDPAAPAAFRRSQLPGDQGKRPSG
jgi:hypothetical protein